MGLKYKINEQFFETWNQESAYLAGLLCADGNLLDVPSIRAKYFSLTSTDFELVANMRAILRSQHKIYTRLAVGNRQEAYLLRIGNLRLYEGLTAIGLTPAKSKTLTFPDIPDSYVSDFVRGYFDGDGCVFLERSKKGTKRMLCIFTSGSRIFLEKLEKCLIAKIGVTAGKLYAHGSTKGTYQVRYSTRDSLRLFLFMYNPIPDQRLYLRRKYAIFEEYLELRHLSTVSKIHSVLQNKGPVAK